MKRNGDFLRTFFHAALVSYFHADMTVMATELYYSIDALKQAMESQDDETASMQTGAEGKIALRACVFYPISFKMTRF